MADLDIRHPGYLLGYSSLLGLIQCTVYSEEALASGTDPGQNTLQNCNTAGFHHCYSTAARLDYSTAAQWDYSTAAQMGKSIDAAVLQDYRTAAAQPQGYSSAQSQLGYSTLDIQGLELCAEAVPQLGLV